MKSTTSVFGKFAWMVVFSGCLMIGGLSNANDGVISNALISRAGLQVEWFSHSGIGVRGEVVDWHLNINENKPTTHFTIRSGGYREKFSQNTLGPFGKPLGVGGSANDPNSLGALEYAGIRKEVLTAELKHRGAKDPQVMVDQYTLPESTIYLLTDTGSVKAMDADTGEVRWKNRVGEARFRSIGIGANNTHVAVVKGKSVYCLDATNGRVLWSGKCRSGASAPPSVSEDSIYVPLLNGRLEVFKFENKGALTQAFVATGEGISRPILTESLISWATDNGHMNVARYDGKAVAYQLRADGPIKASPTYKSGTFYATSLDGFIYAVSENRGSINWQVSTGAPISEPAIPAGDSVFVINQKNELFKLNTKSGAMAKGWESPINGISRYVGTGKTSLFALDPVGNLKVISQETGAILSTVPFGQVDKILPNFENDRLYVASRRGLVQCIREVASPIPHFHANEFGVVQIDPADMAAKAKAAAKPKMEADAGADSLNDPFATGNAEKDPFAPAAKPAPKPDEDDPFGNGKVNEDDPFGNGKVNEDDPFGEKKAADENDPFG